MIKFPNVISKNGILNGTLAILLVGGLCSSIGNFLISRLAIKHNEKSYAGLSRQLMGRTDRVCRIIIFIFRSIVLFYMIELSNKFLKTSELTAFISPSQTPFVLCLILFLVVFLLPDPNTLVSGVKRNAFSFILMGLVTSTMALFKYRDNLDDIKFFNESEKTFESFPLLFICFAQQLGTTPILSSQNTSKTQIATCGILSALSYILIGVTGYISSPVNDLNWFSSIYILQLRVILSIGFLILNVIPIPLIFLPIRDEIPILSNVESTSTLRNCGTGILIAIYTFLSIVSVPTKFLGLLCLSFSAIIMTILPSLFYLRSKDTSRGSRILAYLNLGIGSSFIVKHTFDYICTRIY